MTNLEKTIQYLKTQIDDARTTLVAFSGKLAEASSFHDGDPSYEFTWGDNAVKASAMVREASLALALVKHTEDVAVLVKDLTEGVIRDARAGAHSTSTMSNLVSEYRLAARAELLDRIKSRGLDL